MANLATIVTVNSNPASRYWVRGPCVGGRAYLVLQQTSACVFAHPPIHPPSCLHARPSAWLLSFPCCLPLALHARRTSFPTFLQAGLNAYSCLSAAQFAERVLMTAAPNTTTTATSTTTNAAAPAAAPAKNSKGSKGSRALLAKYGSVAPTYPSFFNWAIAGKVLPAPGFQAACGSSWAFAAAGALESKLMIGSKLATTAALSPQHIMVSSRGVGCTEWGQHHRG